MQRGTSFGGALAKTAPPFCLLPICGLCCTHKSMFDPQKIPLFRVKQAYGLDDYEPQELLDHLSPDSVFPYELWQKAYSSYWKYSAAECSRLYKVENPPFPETHQMPEKHFPTDTYATWIVDFFYEMARRISVKDLENGFDYIVETTYGSKSAVNDSDRTFLFYHLQLVENNIASVTRVEGVKNIDLKLSAPHVLSNMFTDAVAVNNIASIHYWSVIRGYPLKQEVKGITHELVKYVVKRAAEGTPLAPETVPPLDELAADLLPQKEGNVIRVPAALWEGRPPAAIRDAMRSEYSDAVIAYVLFRWREVSKTTIGSVLLEGTLPPEKMPTDDKTFRNLTNKLLKEAESLTIVKA